MPAGFVLKQTRNVSLELGTMSCLLPTLIIVTVYHLYYHLVYPPVCPSIKPSICPSVICAGPKFMNPVKLISFGANVPPSEPFLQPLWSFRPQVTSEMAGYYVSFLCILLSCSPVSSPSTLGLLYLCHLINNHLIIYFLACWLK